MHRASPVPEGRIWNKTFFIILLVSFFMFSSMYMLLPTLPLYARTLGGNETVAGTIVALFTLSAVLVRPWFGNLLDRKGRKLILIIGVGIFWGLLLYSGPKRQKASLYLTKLCGVTAGDHKDIMKRTSTARSFLKIWLYLFFSGISVS